MPKNALPPTPPSVPHPVHSQALGQGIWCIDTGYHGDGVCAAYVVIENGQAALIDTGTVPTLPRLLKALFDLGVAPGDVRWVIPTHVHLDHAGAAGALMQIFPHAQLCIHPRGARHMSDPSALWSGALAVYGEDFMRENYGELVAVPGERMIESHEGQSLSLGQRTLQILHTPGHAYHHHCVWDAQSGTLFSGDAFGLSYLETQHDGQPWSMLTTTPVQFDPPAMSDTLRRLLALPLQQVALTHFSAVQGADVIQRMGQALLDEVQDLVSLTLSAGAACQPQADPQALHTQLVTALRSYYRERLKAHGHSQTQCLVEGFLANDIELNAQGLGVWLLKQRPSPAS